LPVVLPAFEHFIGSAGSHDLRVRIMFADEQIGGSLDVAFRDHSGFGL
jgi:hypothetical protein